MEGVSTPIMIHSAIVAGIGVLLLIAAWLVGRNEMQ